MRSPWLLLPSLLVLGCGGSDSVLYDATAVPIDMAVADDATTRDLAHHTDADAPDDATRRRDEDAGGEDGGGAGGGPTLPGGPLARPFDPIVLTGAKLKALEGLMPSSLVAFTSDGTTWTQIPLQVDERVTVDLAKVTGFTTTGVTFSAYADPQTVIGADTDPTFDADDELVFMARYAGKKAAAKSRPSGITAHAGVELTLSGSAYVYLFEQAGSLDQGAHTKAVTYTPSGDAADASTAYYAEHFASRWVTDAIELHSGDATGVDILDRTKIQILVGQCGETEATFATAEGAFATNHGGPVRAIRSYFGAESGPYTQREHVLYEAREEVRTFLRVHELPGVADLIDYSDAAIGMHYFDSLGGSDVIDGTMPTSSSMGQVDWELVTGAPGSIVHSFTFTTQMFPNFAPGHYYEDNAADLNCTGDGHSYGVSGPVVTQPLPCTDPTIGCSPLGALSEVRVVTFGPPGWSSTDATQRDHEVRNPIAAKVTSWP